MACDMLLIVGSSSSAAGDSNDEALLLVNADIKQPCRCQCRSAFKSNNKEKKRSRKMRKVRFGLDVTSHHAGNCLDDVDESSSSMSESTASFYSDDETNSSSGRELLWYTAPELEVMIQEAQEEFEPSTIAAFLRSRQNRRTSLTAVLEEQALQCQEHIFDEVMIAQIYAACTERSQKEALLRAMKDEIAALEHL
jgi:hypothetical protein